MPLILYSKSQPLYLRYESNLPTSLTHIIFDIPEADNFRDLMRFMVRTEKLGLFIIKEIIKKKYNKIFKKNLKKN